MKYTQTELFFESVHSIARDVVIYTVTLGIIAGFLYMIPETQAEEPRETQFSQDKKTHFLVEYYVDSQRYVRTLNVANTKLIEGTAKDLGINPAHLLAMCIQEGSVPNPDGNYYACDPEAVGDNGKALGAFQIHTGYHAIKREDAKHLYYSAVWTAERLLQKGYLYNKERAIRCHNSCNPSNSYGERVLQIARTLKPIQ